MVQPPVPTGDQPPSPDHGSVIALLMLVVMVVGQLAIVLLAQWLARQRGRGNRPAIRRAADLPAGHAADHRAVDRYSQLILQRSGVTVGSDGRLSGANPGPLGSSDVAGRPRSGLCS